MESRLRKLLSPRRSKVRSSNIGAKLDLHSVPDTTVPPQPRLPMFINHAVGKASTVMPKSDPTSDLRSFSYESTAQGKPPELGDRPQRGNGPVKLQTSRRLSSGELLVTQQDYDRTLEDIRHGEFIVGGKERRTSRTSSQPKSPTHPPDLKFISTAPNSPRGHATFSTPSWSPPLAISEAAGTSAFSSPAPAPAIFTPQQDIYSSIDSVRPHHTHPNPTNHGLGISSPIQRLYSRHTASTTSLLEPHEEQNPTIQALWKAEYSRLVSIYGQVDVDRNLVELNRDRASVSALIDRQPLANRDTSYSSSSLSLNQSLHPTFELGRRGLGIGANASVPNLELAYRDDHSERSSHQRYSLLSSSGASSSFTARTSLAEDSVTSREDLRKIVDDMRMTYLHALEAHTPPLQPLSDLPNRTPRSKKQTTSLASTASVGSSVRPVSGQSITRTKSWQSSTTYTTTPRTSISSPQIKSASKRTSSATSRRTSCQPVAGISTLPAIQASPARAKAPKKDDDVGLKRADSTTLGSMARKLTILDNYDSSSSSQPTFTSSPTFYHSPGSESDSGPNNASPSTSSKPSPVKTCCVQHTPEKHTAQSGHDSAPATQSWQSDVDRLFVDAELDLSLDIDDFEILCEGLFNTHAKSQTWGRDERDDSDMRDNDDKYM